MNPVNHVAIIMDGNGRWGIKHKNSRNAGHRAGLNTVESVIVECLKINIKYLTLYTFSTENWKRPKKEINFLFNLLENFLTNKIDNLIKKNIKVKFIGEINKLPIRLRKIIKKSELGLNPQIDGQLIRLPVPDLNEERRIEIKKLIKSMGEKCKISIRNIRREANDDLKSLVKDKEISEDDEKINEKIVQSFTDEHIKTIDNKVEAKEKEIMTI